MDELIKSIAQRANISNDAARIAIDVIVSHFKTRLPAPLAGQIDALLGSGSLGGGTLGGSNASSTLAKDAENLLGGLLNNK